MNVNVISKINGYLWEAKKILRSRFLDLLRYLAGVDDCREILVNLVREQTGYPKPCKLLGAKIIASPYSDIGYREETHITRLRSDIVFVTGRFRSGSTLVWNLFRNIPDVISYYEPFNERRWFDKEKRGLNVDYTHRNVKEYWTEYDGLDVLNNYYDEAWTYRQLYMDTQTWNPSMQRYIEILVESAKGRPVLQFNRVDFRLPWLRNCFPNAKILHIFRHPRDQWCSTLGSNFVNRDKLKLQDFEQVDGFYLLSWGRDLRNYFPFLTLGKESHPYELFYQIWMLSYLFGCAYSSVSISFEDILENPEATLKKMFSVLSFESYDLPRLVSLVDPVLTGKWTQFADQQWFSAIEEKVDQQIRGYFDSFNLFQQ